MTIRRDTSGDEMDALLAGQQAFWNGDALSGEPGSTHYMGWMAAAAEARRMLTAYRKVLERVQHIAGALEAAARVLKWVATKKLYGRQRSDLHEAQVEINTELCVLRDAQRLEEKERGNV